MIGKAKAAAQGPMHTVRGSGEQEKMLHNARAEYQEEAHEIATYTVIDSLATAVGDKQTSKLARDILRQEERMQQFLAKLLPELTVDVAHDEIPSLIAASRVLAQPSLVEPLGQALLEAMACGRSVVATRIGGPPEFVPPEAGVLIDPLDVDEIARALATAAALPCPNQAARNASASHDVHRQVERIEAILSRAADRRA